MKRLVAVAAMVVLVPGAILLSLVLIGVWLVCPARVERAMRDFEDDCPRGL